jgi:hypothetical protein
LSRDDILVLIDIHTDSFYSQLLLKQTPKVRKVYEMVESMVSNSALYPLNTSLAEEVERLFLKWAFSYKTAYNETSDGKHVRV